MAKQAGGKVKKAKKPKKRGTAKSNKPKKPNNSERPKGRESASARLERQVQELKGDDRKILDLANNREILLRSEIDRVQKMETDTKIDSNPILELAMVNHYCERAQFYSSRRADEYVGKATKLAWMVSALIVTALALLASQAHRKVFDGVDPTFLILQNVTFAAIFFASLYFLVSLCRAYLHEATTLFDRRNALRFGQMFIYLKFAGVKNPDDLMKLKESLNPLDLARAFGWKPEASTAFKDINPSDMTSIGRLRKFARRAGGG